MNFELDEVCELVSSKHKIRYKKRYESIRHKILDAQISIGIYQIRELY